MVWPWSSPASLLSIRNRNLLLRLPTMGDYDQWFNLRRSSKDFLRPFEPRWTEADLGRSVFAMRVKRAKQEAEEGTDYSFLIFDISKRSEILVGGVTLSNMRRRAAQFCSLGYWMGHQYAGRGYMSQAVGMVVPYAFDTLELHRIHAAILPGNLPSRRVLEKSGFVEEGFAEKYLQINGRWEDHVLFGLPRERYDLHRATRALR
jgi:ribosomal-protein-alanine N-acetyltransferase